MNEPFILEITYGHEVLSFPAAFQRYEFSYRIAVSIDDQPFIFELDEEGSYRVLDLTPHQPTPDLALVRAIADKLQQLQKF